MSLNSLWATWVSFCGTGGLESRLFTFRFWSAGPDLDRAPGVGVRPALAATVPRSTYALTPPEMPPGYRLTCFTQRGVVLAAAGAAPNATTPARMASTIKPL